jgi:predicted nucleic acid-binding protein
MYLADTNIFLEGLLEQERAADVRSFLQTNELEKIFITDLSLYSIGIILFRLRKYKLLVSFLDDLILGGIGILSLKPMDIKRLGRIARKFRLDFDDAYQYFVAEKHKLQLISFDKDFDRTPRGRKEPTEVIPQEEEENPPEVIQ